MIIVPGNSDGITHLYDESTSYDDHTVQGISGRTELYTLTVSKKDGTLFATEEYTALAQKFLDVISEITVVESCGQTCGSTGISCLTSNTCSCRKWRYFYSGMSGAYVPAITVCNQQLF